MTQLHPSPTEEQAPAESIAQVDRNTENIVTPAMFWGTIIQAAIIFLASAAVSFLTFSGVAAGSEQTLTGTAYLSLTLAAVLALANVSSIVLTIRRRQDIGYALTYLSLAAFVLSFILIIQGRALFLSFFLLLPAALGIGWICPPRSRRFYSISTVIAFILAWVIEWINPPWRTEYEGVQIGPIAAIIFAVIFAAVMARQAWRGNLRTKLLTAFIGVTVVTAGALGAYMIITTSNNLQENLGRELSEEAVDRATRIGDLFNEQINTLTTLSLNEALQSAVESQNESYEGNSAAIQATLDAYDVQWRAADEADNNNHPLVRENLNNVVAREAIEYQQAFPANVEVFLTDVYGGLAGTTNRTSDYYQADEGWWQAAYNDGQGAVYISEPEFDESAGAFGVQIALPLRDQDTGEITGILRTTYIVSPLVSILEEKIGETGEADLFIPGEVVSEIHEGEIVTTETGKFEALQAVFGQSLVEMEYEDELSVVTQAQIQTLEGNPFVDNLGWVVVFHQHQDEAFAPVNEQVQGVVTVMVIIVVLAAAAAFVFSLFLVRPITRLTATAEEISAGNIDTRAEVTSADEIGTLATAFNTMTSQLREFIGTLEERVAERTQDQATVADIATRTATIQDLQEMLATMVHLTQRGFGLYHAHVFLYHENTEELQIVACGYKEGDEHEGTHGTSIIPLAAEQSLVARCARNREPVIVNDVRSDPGWLPNPLLPDTHAEMAVPMIVGDKLLGVLDVQAETVDAFDEADANIQMTLAAQVAIAVQNILQFQTSQKMAADLGVVTEVGIAATTISDANTLLQEVVNLSKESFKLYHAHIYLMDEEGDTLQLAAGAGEVGRQMVSEGRSIELNSEKSLVARAARTRQGVVVNDVTEDPDFLPNPLLPETRAEMAVPMIVAGKVIGVLDVQSETVGRFTELDVNIKTTLASQVAVALENARSFQEAQKQAERETKLNLITQRIQGAGTIEDALQIAARELGHALGKRQTLVALDPATLAGEQKQTETISD